MVGHELAICKRESVTAYLLLYRDIVRGVPIIVVEFWSIYCIIMLHTEHVIDLSMVCSNSIRCSTYAAVQ